MKEIVPLQLCWSVPSTLNERHQQGIAPKPQQWPAALTWRGTHLPAPHDAYDLTVLQQPCNLRCSGPGDSDLRYESLQLVGILRSMQRPVAPSLPINTLIASHIPPHR